MKKIARNAAVAFGLLFFTVTLDACTTAREREAETDLQQFTSWVNAKAGQVENFSEEQWKEVKREYKQQTNKLDQNVNELSNDAKEQYRATKYQFNEWERNAEMRREAEKLEQEEAMRNTDTSELEAELLGDTTDISMLQAPDMRNTYITFMQQVRRKKSNWNDADWDKAEMVLEKLNQRREQVQATLSTKDKAKIAALQMEFQSLQTGSDLEDVYKNEIKDTYKDVKD